MAAVQHGPTRNAPRVLHATRKIFTAFTIDVFFSFSFHVHFHFNLSLSASCLHSMHFDDFVGWSPKCEIDGTYLAKQCRGDKLTGRYVLVNCATNLNKEITFRCFCYAETGEKIFGWEWWRKSDEMTCACSRQRFKAEASGRLDCTLHCLPNGNFESLQCDMGICWCADEREGHIMEKTFAVPESLWTYLPCCKF